MSFFHRFVGITHLARIRITRVHHIVDGLRSGRRRRGSCGSGLRLLAATVGTTSTARVLFLVGRRFAASVAGSATSDAAGVVLGGQCEEVAVEFLQREGC